MLLLVRQTPILRDRISTDLFPLAMSKCSGKCAQNASIQCSQITADSLVFFMIFYLNLIDGLRH